MRMLEDQLSMVERFHLDITKMPIPEFPVKLTGERLEKRLAFIREEGITEFGDAETCADQADALVDLIYVAMGGLLEMGIRPGPAFKLVHERNMAKVSGANKRGSQFESAKPPGWYPPEWDKFLGVEIARAQEERGRYIKIKPRKKLLLLGHGRHGKDTVAEILRDKYAYRFTSSSMFCAEKVMMPAFARAREAWFKLPLSESSMTIAPPFYSTVEECFSDRHNHRAFWFKEIEAYNYPDRAKLAKDIYAEHDIYVGIRSAKEFNAAKNSGVFGAAVWVDAMGRLPPEDSSSITVQPWMADFTLDNNGSLEDLEFNVHQLMEQLY